MYEPAPDTNPVVDALTRTGLYRHAAGGNEHRLVCPFADEHAPGQTDDAYYFAPSEEVPMGSFHCGCTHAEPRGIGALLKHLGIDRQAARCKPLIRLLEGEQHRIVARAEEVLAKRGGFYRSNGIVVTLKTDPLTGDVTTETVTEQSMTMHLSAACDWVKYDGRSKKEQRRDVPVNIVTALLKSQTLKEIPLLTGLVRQPYLRRGDGKLITTPGYDVISGTYAAFDPAAFHIPLLTKENALAALCRLKSLLDEFEFESEVDRATACCAMLTASIRDYLRVAPGFNITASSSGSGKSCLASVIAPFAGPGDARNISYPSSNDEASKVVISLALEQPAAVCFDDMPTDWLAFGAMNRMLTNESISERKLGTNQLVTGRAASIIMGTGNNIRPLRDMARRVASIYLLPKVETAALREYKGNPVQEVRHNRGRYVSDALTIVAAWRATGSPRASVPNVAGFEDWSDLCRHSLIWLGEPDPAKSLIEQIAQDPDKEQLGNLLQAWKEVFGSKATLTRQVLKHIDENKRDDDLYDAVMETPGVERGFANPTRFGRYLARNKNRIVNGLRLVEVPHSERRGWAVMPVSAEPVKVNAPIPKSLPAGFERTWQDDPLAQGKSIPVPSTPGDPTA